MKSSAFISIGCCKFVPSQSGEELGQSRPDTLRSSLGLVSQARSTAGGGSVAVLIINLTKLSFFIYFVYQARIHFIIHSPRRDFFSNLHKYLLVAAKLKQ